MLFFFFFSSRRRHTRFDCDWSSDVCSSDLAINTAGSIVGAVLTGFVLVVTLGTDLTLRVGLLVNVVAALALAGLAARGIAEGSVEHRRLGARVLGAGGVAGGFAPVSPRAAALGPELTTSRARTD